MRDLYTRLMELCQQKGVSGYRFCKDTGLQPSMLTDLKAGRQSGISPRKAAIIAEYFGVPVSYILYEKTEEDNEKKPTVTEELSFIEKELLRCWKMATDIERQAIATLLSQYGMPKVENKMGASRSERGA